MFIGKRHITVQPKCSAVVKSLSNIVTRARSTSATRVALCSEQALVRRGIRETLAETIDLRLAGEAADLTQLQAVLQAGGCDLLLLDLAVLGTAWLDGLAQMIQARPGLQVLVLSSLSENPHAVRCLRAGAQGFLRKACEPHELVAALRVVAQGRKYVSPEVAQMLANNVAQPSADAPHETLSERELQTLMGIAAGKRLADIAAELMLSPKTVSVYRSRVLDKLRLSNNAAIAVYAMRHNLA